MQELKSLGGQECSVSYFDTRVRGRLGTRRAGRGRGARKSYQVVLPDLSLLKYHIPKLCAPGEALTPPATSPTISLC